VTVSPLPQTRMPRRPARGHTATASPAGHPGWQGRAVGSAAFRARGDIMLFEHAHHLAHFDFVIACDDLQLAGQELAAGALPGAVGAAAVWLVAGVGGRRRRLRAGSVGLG